MDKNIGNKKKLIGNILRRSIIMLSFIFIIGLISCTSNNTSDTESQNNTSITLTSSFEVNAIYDTYKNSVFRLDSKNKDGLTTKQGTGYILKEDGTFVTNAHVLRNSWNAVARFDVTNSVYYIEGIYYYDEESDIAIGKLNITDDFSVQPITFADQYDVDDTVFSIGYPKYSTEAVVTKGKILSTYYTSDIFDMVYIRTDSYLESGNSGGILSTADGEVIGITSVSFSDTTFGSIRSNEYSSWQTSELGNLVSLTEYFHPSIDIQVDKDNVEEYFDIEILDPVITDDINNESLIIDYEMFVTPDTFLELTDINSGVFVAMIILVDYYYINSDNYMLTHQYIDISVSFNLDGQFLTEHIERSAVIQYDPSDIIISVTNTYKIVYSEGTITVYE